MKTILKKFSIYFIVFISVTLTNCKKDNPTPSVSNEGSNSLTIHFENLMDGSALIIDTETDSVAPPTTFTGVYTNAASNKLTVKSLKYIISNIVLTKSDGTTWAEPASYHLVEVTDSIANDEFELKNVSGGNYTKITFMLGVDSAANNDLTKAQGDLVELSKMVWTWNTGYEFYRLEGRYQKTNVYKRYLYSIGLDRNRKTITLDLPTEAKINKTTSNEVHLKNNILASFGITGALGSVIMDISANPTITMDPVNDVKIANNNAAAFFHVDHVHNESK
jgi:hypothetical protein